VEAVHRDGPAGNCLYEGRLPGDCQPIQACQKIRLQLCRLFSGHLWGMVKWYHSRLCSVFSSRILVPQPTFADAKPSRKPTVKPQPSKHLRGLSRSAPGAAPLPSQIPSAPNPPFSASSSFWKARRRRRPMPSHAARLIQLEAVVARCPVHWRDIRSEPMRRVQFS